MILQQFDRPKDYPVLWIEGFSTAWDECIELQCTPKADWIGSSIVAVQYTPRSDIVIFNSTGNIVGGVIVAEDDDIHVGACMSVLFQYVLPEYRNKGLSLRLMLCMRRMAKAKGLQMIAYTHRKGDWRYETIYKRV